MQAHTSSYYADSVNDQQQYPVLQGEHQCDVCVVGAGFSGLSSALHLAEQGYNVIVLESARVGFGATGRNGGQIVNSYSRDVDTIRQRYDSATADQLCAMIFEGGDIIRERIQRYDIQCAHVEGGVFAALNAKQMAELEAQKRNWEALGNNQLELLDRNGIRAAVGADCYLGGLLDRRGGHLHPLNLALGEARAVVLNGGQIFEQSAVTRIDKGAQPVVHTAQGQVRARQVILAGNAYLDPKLAPSLGRKAFPCGTQVIATEPLPQDLADELLPQNYCVEDCNYLLDYYRLTEDRRLLFGGGVVYGAREPESVEALIRPKMEKVFPMLAGVGIDYAWTGNFLLTYSRMPQFGRIDDNLYYLQGYSGHGVTCTHLAGRLVAEAIGGKPERFDAFASLRHLAFPGGRHLQVPFTALGAAYYNLRDKLAL
ncbi:NAD(P)/FAD-dependent oxidoreductase [Ferrimonas marina]|uniref:Gamma-glutamylputrescine oxidase n=1 Tax=Ferrimonas marina TaxID=299255 RepID=A0A1M5YS31_9GAMM|nr:FAD-binding oxidoreductase [Ferrimonas marina]SHI14648.1 gamma-glutamylputrescine oxidase [Ferrimonas marina]